MIRTLTTLTATLFALGPLAGANTDVSGEITTTTWTAAMGPYQVTDTITVPTGNTLTIEPSVDVLFDADVPFVVEGALDAVGTEVDSIRFIAGTADEWGGIRFNGGDSSTIHYARVSDAFTHAPSPFVGGEGGGIHLLSSSLGLAHSVVSGNTVEGYGGGLFADSATVTLDSCAITGNAAKKAMAGGDGGGVYAVESTVSLTGCAVSQDSAAGAGGGVHGRNSTLSLEACDIQDNASLSTGGGLHLVGGTVGMTVCSVSNNDAGGTGGGLYTTGVDMVLADCDVSGNASGASGGGLCVAGSGSGLTLTDCTVSANVAGLNGGGMVLNGVTATLAGCAVDGNSAGTAPVAGGGSGNGGGFSARGGAITLYNSTVNRNTAGKWGGGFYTGGTAVTMGACELRGNASWGGAPTDFFGGSTVTMTNCLVAGNTAFLPSAGLDFHDASATLVNCTVVDNRSLGEPGCTPPDSVWGIIGAAASSPDQTITLINSIIWGHSGDHGLDYWLCGAETGVCPGICIPGPFPPGAPTTATYCAAGAVNVEGWWSSVGNVNADPMFVDTIAYALLPSSPCIDTGSHYILDEDGSPSDMGYTGGGRYGRCQVSLVPDTLYRDSTDFVRVRNVGDAPLGVFEPDLPDSFVTDMVFPQAVEPDSTLYIPVTYTQRGYHEKTAVIHTSDPWTPDTVVLLKGKWPVAIAAIARPPAFALSPNVPNPFNPATRIPYALASDGDVRLVLYNTLGQRVRTVVDEYRSAGEHSVVWNGRDDADRPAASGVYIVRLTHTGANRNDSRTNSNAVRVRRVTLLR